MYVNACFPFFHALNRILKVEQRIVHIPCCMLKLKFLFRCIFKLDEQLKEIGCDVWKWNWAMSIFYESIRLHTQAVAAIAIDIWPKNVPVDGQLWVYWPNSYINSEWNSFWFTSFWLWTCLSYALEFVLRYAFMGESTIKFSSAHCKFWKIVLQYS